MTRTPGDLPEVVDERLKSMEEAVPLLKNLSEYLRLLVESPSAKGHSSISEHFVEAYMTDPLPGKIFEGIQLKSSLEKIRGAECSEQGERKRGRRLTSIHRIVPVARGP